MFEHLVGNDPIKAYLERGLRLNTLPHALLFSGIQGVGKSLFATTLSKALLKTSALENHPDYHPIYPESKSGVHAIDSLRLLIDEVHQVSFDGKGKVFVIYDAHKMQPASANAILKTLEEPTPGTTLILLTEHKEEILPTICSRCAHLEFRPINESLIKEFLKRSGMDPSLASKAHGSIGKALSLTEISPFEGEVLSLLREELGYPDFLQKLENIEKLVDSEDPVQKMDNTTTLFEMILMWFRDQHAKKIGVPDHRLFFQKEALSNKTLPHLEKVIQYVNEARVGVQRNIKLSACIESLFFSLTKENPAIK